MSRESSLVQFPEFVSQTLTADIEAIREVTQRFGVVLISDEVLYFRQSYTVGASDGSCRLQGAIHVRAAAHVAESPSMGCIAKRPERRSRPSDLFSILLRIRVE